MDKIFSKDTFNKISQDKRDRILQTAIDEFANNGYNSANINVIAKKADVSVGSMYKYFNTKHDLYLYVVQHAVSKLKLILDEIIINENDFISMIYDIIRAIQIHSRNYVSLTKLYNQMATENNSELVWHITSKMEGVTANLYCSFIKNGQTNGLVRKDINPRYFAFFLDNLFMMLQFSYSCEYYKERLKLYVSPDVFNNDELLAKELTKFIKNALYTGK